MLDRTQIKKVVDGWERFYLDSLRELIPRKLPLGISKRNAVGFVGVRRGGKTFLSIELTKDFSAQTLYINFEDPLFYLDSDLRNLDEIVSVYTEFHGHAPRAVIYDEIQNIPGWERWVRKVVDQKPFKVIVSGSSAQLLSSELSTAIAGRCIEERVWPLSYREYLLFRKSDPGSSDEHRAMLRQYFTWGGFPEIALEGNEREKRKLLLQYGSDIIAKDVVGRHEVRNKRVVDQLLTYYATNISSLHSYRAIKGAFRISVDMAADYTRYLSEAFYCFEVNRFHKNLKVQDRDPKKIYVIDPA